MMKYKREDRVKILEYKFVFEEEIQVNKEFQEGSADLNYRLSFFREKLDIKNNTDQKSVYDSMFMGQVNENNTNNHEITSVDDTELAKSANRTNHDIKPWAKILYKKIVMITHPDKTAEIKSLHLKEKLIDQ